MTEDDVPILQQYGAQIESLIRQNNKDINENSSNSVILTIKLYNKFFKLMFKKDTTMVKRLFNLLTQPIQTPLKCKKGDYNKEKQVDTKFSNSI